MKHWIQNAKKWRRRRIYKAGMRISRFIAKDVKREIEIVSAEEIDDGFVMAKVRTYNLLYLSKRLTKKEPFSPAQRMAIDDLWKWTGKSWGGLPDGTSIVEKTESEIEQLRNDT